MDCALSSHVEAPRLLQLARGTRHLPSVRGLSSLLKVYQALLPRHATYRIQDFDGDLRLDVNVRECVGINLWHAPDQYERGERLLFCSNILPGATVLDIGANIGIFTLLAAKRGARVFAIEADPRNAAALRRHVELNHLSSRVTIFQLAAVDAPQTLTLYQNHSNHGGSSIYGQGSPTTVTGATVDSLGLPPIDLCKIDIEGAESAALRGMKATIARSPHLKLLIEYSEPHGPERAAGLLRLIRASFSHLSVVNGPALGLESPPPYCNLWCTGVRHADGAV